MSGATIIVLVVGFIASQAPASEMEDFCWTESFHDLGRWTRRPEWLGNPSPGASATRDGQAACFQVDEPRKGMKWSAPLPAISLADMPYLVVRYRAENVDTTGGDYFIYLDDRVHARQLAALRLSDVAADGQWHVAAVDLTTLTGAEAVHAVAVHVQAGDQGKARVWLDRLSFRDAPPEDARLAARPGELAARPEWTAPLAAAKWIAQNGWLGNPAPQGEHFVERQGETTTFRVARSGLGMKWSWDLPEPLSLEGHRYLSMRYRAKGYRPHSDYALCVLGKPRGKGPGYLTAIPTGEVIGDGRWHNLALDLRRVAAEIPSASTLAIQVQADAPDATLEVASVRLVNQPQPARLADAVDWAPGARWEGFQTVPIQPAAKSASGPWRRHLRLGDWPGGTAATVEGIPFAVVSGPNQADLAATTIRGKSELRIPTGVTASEVYVFLLAAFLGSEEPPYGSGKLKAIGDVDRFRVRLEYADGTVDECLPMNPVAKRFGVVEGPQVLVAAADPAKRLEAVVVRDLCKQAAFGVVAVTVRTSGQRLFPEVLEETPPLRPKQAGRDTASGRGALFILPLPPGEGRGEGGSTGQRGSSQVSSAKSPHPSPLPKGEGTISPLALQRLIHRATNWNLLPAPSPLVTLQVDGKAIPTEALEPLAADKAAAPDFRWYKVRGLDGLRVGVSLKLEGDDSLVVCARAENAGQQERQVTLVSPAIGPYRLSEREEDAYYLVPKRGAAFDNRPCAYRERYCGLFPVQFLDTFSPSDGRGLCLRTLDTDCLWKHYLLEKKGNEFTAGVEYSAALKPGQTLHAAPAVITVTNGDWHSGLEAYRKWLATWYQPLSPRKPWFREVFNFRQRFLWWLDPLYDSKQGTLHLQRAVDEARQEFGGIDYLHLFDWGNCGQYGRIYGRTGDHSPYEYLKGGRGALHKAIAGVQAQGVPVGLYIEAYLLEERGKLGQQFGKAWQLVGADGKGRYWPESTEMYACSYVPAWREVQASTYAAKVKELNVDGTYLDEYGFAGTWVDCWSKSADHGHAAPGYAVVGERDCTRLVRERIEKAKKGVAIYTEETPVDVTTQYQDGSFTYSMSSAHATQTRVPLNTVRFAVPSFKTIEILYCDKPTGSWATGVKWVFFNGEAIWLEGPAAEWFEPETRQAIRQCYRILHKHRDAMTTLDPVPLVPTEMGGVFANAFPIPGKTVYTLYNSRRRTVRGEVLRLPRGDGAAYYDECRERPAAVRIDGTLAAVSVEIGPQDVGCIVVKP